MIMTIIMMIDEFNGGGNGVDGGDDVGCINVEIVTDITMMIMMDIMNILVY